MFITVTFEKLICMFFIFLYIPLLTTSSFRRKLSHTVHGMVPQLALTLAPCWSVAVPSWLQSSHCLKVQCVHSASPLLCSSQAFRNTEVLQVVFLRMLFSVGEGVLKLESFEEASQGRIVKAHFIEGFEFLSLG